MIKGQQLFLKFNFFAVHFSIAVLKLRIWCRVAQSNQRLRSHETKPEIKENMLTLEEDRDK